MAIETYRHHPEWIGIALPDRMSVSTAYRWARSEHAEGEFVFAHWHNMEDHTDFEVFRFSLPEVAVHFRLLFDGKIIASNDSLRLHW